MTEPKINGFHSAVTTSNGNYTVGMTREQAEKKKLYKCFTGLDFKDLDKNKDGVLSQKEILEGRVESVVRKQNQKIYGGYAISTLSFLALPFTGGVSAAIGLFATGIAGCGYSLYQQDKAQTDKEFTDAVCELHRYQQTAANKQKGTMNTKA